jgi:hypothetical protein
MDITLPWASIINLLGWILETLNFKANRNMIWVKVQNRVLLAVLFCKQYPRLHTARVTVILTSGLSFCCRHLVYLRIVFPILMLACTRSTLFALSVLHLTLEALQQCDSIWTNRKTWRFSACHWHGDISGGLNASYHTQPFIRICVNVGMQSRLLLSCLALFVEHEITEPRWNVYGNDVY